MSCPRFFYFVHALNIINNKESELNNRKDREAKEESEDGDREDVTGGLACLTAPRLVSFVCSLIKLISDV